MTASGRRIVIGIGNPDRGDDGAGRAVIRRLAGRAPGDVELIHHDGEATSLLSTLDGADLAILVDASAARRMPGAIARFDAVAEPLPAESLDMSTHGFGLVAAIELARALDVLPLRCIVYAIEGTSFEPGSPLSADVATAVENVTERVLIELATDAASGARRQHA